MMKIGDEMIACSCANPACLEKGCQLQGHPSAHTLNIIPHTTDEVIRLKQEVERLKARLRKTAQILIQAVGADGPMDAEVAAEKIVMKYWEAQEALQRYM